MDRNGAPDTENNLIIIFIVTNTTNGTASPILSNKCPLLLIHLLNLLLQLHPPSLTISAIIVPHTLHSVHLVQNLAIFHVISSLLSQFELLEEIILKFAGIVQIQQKLVHVLVVPVAVVHDVLHVVRVHVAYEVLAVFADVLGLVHGLVAETG